MLVLSSLSIHHLEEKQCARKRGHVGALWMLRIALSGLALEGLYHFKRQEGNDMFECSPHIEESIFKQLVHQIVSEGRTILAGLLSRFLRRAKLTSKLQHNSQESPANLPAGLKCDSQNSSCMMLCWTAPRGHQTKQAQKKPNSIASKEVCMGYEHPLTSFTSNTPKRSAYFTPFGEPRTVTFRGLHFEPRKVTFLLPALPIPRPPAGFSVAPMGMGNQQSKGRCFLLSTSS